MYSQRDFLEEEVFRSLLGITLIIIGIILLFFGISFYVLKNMPSNIHGNGTTIIIIPPFIVIQGGFDPLLLVLIIIIVLLIPILLFYMFLKSIHKPVP